MTVSVVIAVALVQAAAMLADEGWFHRTRGLPSWERIGHPLDTLTVIACYAWLSATHPSRAALTVYVVLAAFSCLFVTKDEPIHRRLCTPAECWVHGVLFVVHPVVLACFAWAWSVGALWLVHAQLALTVGVLLHQVLYWSVLRRAPA